MRLTIAALLMTLTIAAALAAPRAGATDQNPSDVLEQMARSRFGQLSHAEIVLVRSAPQRQIQWAGPSENPADPSNDPAHGESWGPQRTIRAALLAWLCTDPDATRLVHPSGPGIIGARITGLLDLSYQRVPFPLTLVRCAIRDGVNISYANIRGLDLRASVTGPILANCATVRGDVSLTFGSYGPVDLFRANIDGSLEFSAARVESPEPVAISAVESTIGGDAVFHQGFATNGLVDMRLAHIGQSLSFNHARFFGAGSNGLDAERTVIRGPLYWTDVSLTPHTELDLEDARAGALWDDEASWPAAGNLMLDGFQYGRFGADSPADAKSRLRWLRRQPPGYWPQPYAELAKALAAGGENEDAITVEIAKRVDQRRHGGLGWSERAWNAMLQVTIGYGFIPMRAIWWILGFVAVGTVLFRWGYTMRVVTPTEENAYEAFVKTGSTPPHYPPFNAFVYSLENFLPVVELHQGEYWRPNPGHGTHGHMHARGEGGGHLGNVLRWYLWLHILAGWILTPLLAAGLSGLIHVG